MTSLSAHLREPGDHGRLAFHPECPICRDERLAGALPADAIVGRRAQALFATGVLAFASTPLSAALAAAPDQEREGTSAPEQIAAVDPAADADFDPGGESTDLPFDAGSPPAPQAAPAPDEDTEALEQEPATDELAPVADAGDPASTQAPAGQPQTPVAVGVTPQATSETPPAAAPTPAPAAPTGEPVPPPVTAHSNIRATGGQNRKKERAQPADGSARPVRTAPEPEPVIAAPEPEPVIVATEASEATVSVADRQSTPTSAVPADGRAARPGGRFHVVLAGESLWSISKDVLGDEASVAQVARMVNRLWELNSDRIGTGDPDLLQVGTKLALR